MEPQNSGQRINSAKSVREAINQDGAVLLDLKQGLCFSMNPVGARVWEILKAGATVDQVVSTLESEFPVPRTEIETDVAEFLDNLKMRNLIRVGSESNAERENWFVRLLP